MPIYRPGKDANLKLMPAKDPDAISKPYTVVLRGNAPGDTTSDPATYLADSVSITSATVILSGDPLLTLANTTVGDNYVTAWLSGGTLGVTATVTIRFVTDLSNGAGGYYGDDISFFLPIKSR